MQAEDESCRRSDIFSSLRSKAESGSERIRSLLSSHSPLSAAHKLTVAPQLLSFRQTRLSFQHRVSRRHTVSPRPHPLSGGQILPGGGQVVMVGQVLSGVGQPLPGGQTLSGGQSL